MEIVLEFQLQIIKKIPTNNSAVILPIRCLAVWDIFFEKEILTLKALNFFVKNIATKVLLFQF